MQKSETEMYSTNIQVCLTIFLNYFTTHKPTTERRMCLVINTLLSIVPTIIKYAILAVRNSHRHRHDHHLSEANKRRQELQHDRQ